MRKLLNFVLVVAFFALMSGAADAKYDGSVTLLCAPIEINQCDVSGKCYTGSAEDVNLPQFIKVSVKEKLLSSVDEPVRVTPIDHSVLASGKLMLHGGQNGRSWTIIISEETGKLAATIAEDRTGFVIFGACTAL
jgi:hypothetical protein